MIRISFTFKFSIRAKTRVSFRVICRLILRGTLRLRDLAFHFFLFISQSLLHVSSSTQPLNTSVPGVTFIS